MSRPPAQTKLGFGKDGELEAELPEVIEPVFKIGDKVIHDPQYPHIKGVFEVESILLTWGEPLYIVIRDKIFCCSTAKGLIKVE